MAKLHHTDRYLTDSTLRLVWINTRAFVVALVAFGVVVLGLAAGIPALALLGIGVIVLAGLVPFGTMFYVVIWAFVRLYKMGKW